MERCANLRSPGKDFGLAVTPHWYWDSQRLVSCSAVQALAALLQRLGLGTQSQAGRSDRPSLYSLPRSTLGPPDLERGSRALALRRFRLRKKYAPWIGRGT